MNSKEITVIITTVNSPLTHKVSTRQSSNQIHKLIINLISISIYFFTLNSRILNGEWTKRRWVYFEAAENRYFKWDNPWIRKFNEDKSLISNQSFARKIQLRKTTWSYMNLVFGRLRKLIFSLQKRSPLNQIHKMPQST